MNDLKTRFDGLMPVVIDVETGGTNCKTDALLEAAAIIIGYDADKGFYGLDVWHEHIQPFIGSKCCEKALAFNNIVPDHPLRFAITEQESLASLAHYIKIGLKQFSCKRAVLVGHNAHFDLGFIMQAVVRCGIKNFPLHSFTCFDTATLGGVFYKKTVLAKIMREANIKFNVAQAHGALYDTVKTAELFCKILNENNS